MSIVLNASLLPKGNDIITVAIAQSFNGEDVCSFDLNNGTLADLEKTLCDPRGPMFRCLPRSSLHFYTEKEPLRALDLQLQVCSFGSLVIQYKAPDVGKFLEAMQNNKFDPSSANFEMTWTAAEAPAVSAYQTEFMIDQVLSGLPTHADSREHFVRIFGKLTAMGESWIVPRDAMLGKYFSDGRHFKHRLCQHWLEMARDASTSKISEATPIILLKRGDDGRLIGCAVLGDSFPRNFDDGMQRELNDWVLYPDFKWQNVSHALLSLDWDPQEGLALLQNSITAGTCSIHDAPDKGGQSDGPRAAALVLSWSCGSPRVHQCGLRGGSCGAAWVQAEDREVSICCRLGDGDEGFRRWRAAPRNPGAGYRSSGFHGQNLCWVPSHGPLLQCRRVRYEDGSRIHTHDLQMNGQNAIRIYVRAHCCPILGRHTAPAVVSWKAESGLGLVREQVEDYADHGENDFADPWMLLPVYN